MKTNQELNPNHHRNRPIPELNLHELIGKISVDQAIVTKPQVIEPSVPLPPRLPKGVL